RLKKDNYYLLDLDITLDIAGIFNKEEMIKYLVSSFPFSLPGKNIKKDNIIVDNIKTVGIDCLTWLNENSRVKVYNKFICQMTSPGVNKQLGNHFINFINCPDKRLKETFGSELARKNGITRLETTIYNYANNDFDINEKMWKKLTDTLENSCCIVDTTSKRLNYVYWPNKNSSKLTGINIKLPEDGKKEEKVIKYVLSAFLFITGIQFQPTNGMEIKSLIAIHIIMGSLKFPRVRMYWEETFRINIVANTMTRDRFFQLRSNLHIIDNNSIPINNKDKFIKVRPLYDLIKKKCNSLVKERNLSVDEQMVPFKGTLSVKQYMKGKPCPWGIKIYVLAGQSGTVNDFLLYQGGSTEINSDLQKQFGIGGATVLQLTEGVKKNSHFLYFDNFFSSFQLFERLYQKGIYAAGTIRTNRFANPPLLADKIMSKMGRGTSYEIKSKNINNFSLGILKWYDNKPVNIASNFITSGEVEIIKRWDKKNKLYVEVERPEIITLYNKSMGGVDKIDQLISTYRTFIKSKKWTLRLIVHAFDLVVANCWIQYLKDAKYLNIQKNKILDLLHFRLQLANEIINCRKPITPKRKGRPSNTSTDRSSRCSSNSEDICTQLSPQTNKKIKTDSPIPPDAVRYDTIDHLPGIDSLKNPTKCKHPKCTRKHRTHIFCEKC
ncbi:hypothetical protein AGLY_017629, partial [Aphis glycines]